MRRRHDMSAWLLIAFPLAVVFIFTALPTVAGIALSFCTWNAGSEPQFVGTSNYGDLLHSRAFLPALRNTLLIAIVTVPLTVVGAFLFAAALHAPWFRGRGIARTVFFMPTIISIVAIGFIWRWLLSPSQAGLLNRALLDWGVIDAPIAWLQNSAMGLCTLMVIIVWRGLGFSLVLYLAALGSVPRSLYEAAALDGATPWRALWSITWPSVRPMTWFLLITGMIAALQVFDLILVMIGEAHQEWTDVLNLFLYREFTQNRFGFAATIGAVILAVTAGFTFVQLELMRRGAARGG